MPFDAEVRERDAGAVVTLRGELDILSAPVLRDTLLLYTGAVPLVVDLSELDFIDAAGLGILVGAKHRTPVIRFVRGRKNVQKVFAITGLDSYLSFYDTCNQAFNAPIFTD